MLILLSSSGFALTLAKHCLELFARRERQWWWSHAGGTCNCVHKRGEGATVAPTAALGTTFRFQVQPKRPFAFGEELATQGKMLEDLEQDVEGTNSRLAAAQRKMNQVFKKAGTKGQMIIIAILTAILIILFLIAFM